MDCPRCYAENLTDYPVCPSCATECHFTDRPCAHCVAERIEQRDMGEAIINAYSKKLDSFDKKAQA